MYKIDVIKGKIEHSDFERVVRDSLTGRRVTFEPLDSKESGLMKSLRLILDALGG